MGQLPVSKQTTTPAIVLIGLFAAGLTALSVVGLDGRSHAKPAFPNQTDAPAPAKSTALSVETIKSDLENPWGLEFLPDSRFLVTEKSGRIQIISADGTSSISVSNVPKVADRGQGGLLDVTLSPDFATSGTIYLAFSEPAEGGKARTTAISARLQIADGTAKLSDIKTIFQQTPAIGSSRHFGSRIVVAADGSLFITTGDRGSERHASQDPSNTIGVVARVMPDGTPHPDNPKRDGWKPEIYSIGHRNIQGAVLDPETGQLWTIEHGARGGDELNATSAGANYGWPVISYGREYSGAAIGKGITAQDGLEQPIYYWVPSIAVSGLELVGAKGIPGWEGNLLVGGLGGAQLSRLVLDQDKKQVINEEVLLKDKGWRIRDIRQGPDGAIYILVDESLGALVRLTPVAAD